MTTTVKLERSNGDLEEYEADEATEYLSAHGVWWRRPELVPDEIPVYRPSTSPTPQRSKHEWAAQLADDEASSMGEGARRDLFHD